MENEDEEKILFLTFNCDGSCFCIGTNKGFRIYNSYPVKCLINRSIDGGVAIIDVLNRSSVFAFVGTGNRSKFGQNKVILWDENESKVINEIIVKYTIKNIKLKRDKIFIIVENSISVFTLGNIEKIDFLKTYPNKNGIFGISLDPKKNIISYLSPELGKIIIKNYDEKKNGEFLTKEINAHQTEIISLVMNFDGSLIASASSKGTIIKIFKTSNGDIIQELRRGTEPAEIYSLAFDYNSQYIACSSNKGTIHIFNVKSKDNNKVENQKSMIGNFVSFLGFQNSYLNSEWSFAQYRLTCKEKSVVNFAPDNNNFIIVINSIGKYYQGQFDPNYGKEVSQCIENDYLKQEVKNDDD